MKYELIPMWQFCGYNKDQSQKNCILNEMGKIDNEHFEYYGIYIIWKTEGEINTLVKIGCGILRHEIIPLVNQAGIQLNHGTGLYLSYAKISDQTDTSNNFLSKEDIGNNAICWIRSVCRVLIDEPRKCQSAMSVQLPLDFYQIH